MITSSVNVTFIDGGMDVQQQYLPSPVRERADGSTKRRRQKTLSRRVHRASVRRLRGYPRPRPCARPAAFAAAWSEAAGRRTERCSPVPPIVNVAASSSPHVRGVRAFQVPAAVWSQLGGRPGSRKKKNVLEHSGRRTEICSAY